MTVLLCLVLGLVGAWQLVSGLRLFAWGLFRAIFGWRE